MTYRNPHFNCKENCKTYTAYIRIKNKWTPVGEYHTECKTFSELGNNESLASKGRRAIVKKVLEAEELEENLPTLINSLS